MKKLLLSFVAAVTLSFSSLGQAPEGFKYQAVVRDAGNATINNQAVGIRMTIFQGSIGGTTVYSETFATYTNAYGLVNVQIGNGSVLSGTFSNIDWANGPFIMETAIDVTGGTNYSVMGSSQLLSVPYALYAKTSGNGLGPVGPQGIQGPAGLDGTNGTNGIDGIDGATGPQGPAGLNGTDGTNGTNGISAYQTWLGLGNVGTETDFINSLTGPQGIQGTAGNDGAIGPQGPAGSNGTNGQRAYEIAVTNGYIGTEAQWLTSLQGATGATGLLANGSVAGNTPYWDGTSWITNSSNIFNNGGNVGIGTLTPTEKLEVAGNMTLNGTLNNMRVGNIGTGSGNVVFGGNAFNLSSNGDDNTAIGNSAMANSVTGNNNVAVGAYAMGSNASGHTNVAVGWGALVYNTVGIQNNAVGWLALQSNTTGSQNTAIGNQSDVAFGNLNNATAIGHAAIVDASNKIQLGNTDVSLVNSSGYYQGSGFKTPTGTSAQYLMADGSVSSGSTGPQGPAGQGGVTTAGSGINITGAGTVASPYVVSTNSPCGLAIGQTYQGGIIFYLDASGCHGLISAPTDQSTSIVWWNGGFTDTYASGSGLFDGDGNCYGIRRSQGDCASCNAAELCLDLSLGGYSDWYLPSKYELNLMYLNIGQGNALGLGNVGGFAGNVYWSSTESDNFYVWLQYFYGGMQYIDSKNASGFVRAVRAF